MPIKLAVLFIISLLISTTTITTAATEYKNNDSPSCVPEFDKCVTNRDCCAHLECVTGDWQYTTDSTCLSKQSQALETELKKFSMEDKEKLLQAFYELQEQTLDDDTNKKTPEQVAKIAHQYRHDFHKLIAKLEQKYGADSFAGIMEAFTQRQNDNGGGASWSSSSEL